MASNTPNLNLYKKDPVADGNDTFNIDTMLNQNWDKIDAAVASKETPAGAQAKADAVQTNLTNHQNATTGVHGSTTASTPNTLAQRDANGDLSARQLKSTVSSGTAPLSVSSTTVVTNLNADMVDGYHANTASGASTVAVRDSNADLTTRQFKSTATTGTAPLSVSSMTLVTNLNADKIDGYDANTGTTANTIPVRDGSGKLPGSITGDANSVGGQTLANLDARYTAKATGDNHETRITNIEAEMGEGTPYPTTLLPGLNIVNVPRSTPLNVLNLKGRTLINLLGREGGFEDAEYLSVYGSGAWYKDTTNQLYGTQCVKYVANGGTVGISFPITLRAGKRYIAVADIKPMHSVGFVCMLLGGSALAFQPTVGKYQTVYLKLDNSGGGDLNTIVAAYSLSVNSGDYAYVDGIRVYELTQVEYDALTGLSASAIGEKYPYVDDMKGVKGPYVIRYGRNLLPPFTEGYSQQVSGTSKFETISAYKTQLTADAGYQSISYTVPVIAGQVYSISAVLTGYVSATKTPYIGYRFKDASGTNLSTGNVFPTNNGLLKIEGLTTPANAVKLEVIFSNKNDAGTFIFENPMLNIGSSALPFVEQNNDYIFIDGTFHGINGVSDEIIVRDGKVSGKLEKIREVVLDGSLPWNYEMDGAGWKRVTVNNLLVNGHTDYHATWATKYDGKPLDTSDVTANGPDKLLRNTANQLLSVTIPDTDSGWGENYTPTAQEIQAYFYGWKMNNGTFGQPYNGTGTKTWTAWYATDNNQAPTTVPTSMVGIAPNGVAYTPYRLLYQLATPVEVPVTAEGEISLHEGPNVLEVGTGIVRRETVVPSLFSTSYWINGAGQPTGVLSRRSKSILSVYKNDSKTTEFVAVPHATQDIPTYGEVQATTLGKPIDTTATYSVTYLVLDKYLYTAPLIDLQAEYRTKLAGVVAELAQDQADLATRVSVVETQYARKQQGQYIAPVLLNGYMNVYQSGYYKDDMGIVRLKGRLGIGTTSNGTVIFYLPVGYRPSLPLLISTSSGDIYIGTDGGVRIYNYASNPSAANVVLIDGISFRAEQ